MFDFVLAVELGRMIGTDPEGYFHIVSKDTDFDPVVRHLKGEMKLPARRRGNREAAKAAKAAKERGESEWKIGDHQIP